VKLDTLPGAGGWGDGGGREGEMQGGKSGKKKRDRQLHRQTEGKSIW